MLLKEIIEVLETYGRCYSATLELWPPPMEDLRKTLDKEAQWVEESILHLKTLSTRVGD